MSGKCRTPPCVAGKMTIPIARMGSWVESLSLRVRDRTRGLGMIIVLNCPGCKKSYEIDGALAGKKSRCRQCGEVFRIPVPTGRIIEPARPPRRPPARLSRSGSRPRWPSCRWRPGRRPSRPPGCARGPGRRGCHRCRRPAASARSAPAPSEFDDLPPPPRMRHRGRPPVILEPVGRYRARGYRVRLVHAASDPLTIGRDVHLSHPVRDGPLAGSSDLPESGRPSP